MNSMWCKEEFTHCYIENMEDESFNLFVIMMQPADTLVNISPYMKTFFANKTYLQRGDPKLFIKLATHLKDARQQDDDNNDCCKCVISNDEQTEELISHSDQISSIEKYLNDKVDLCDQNNIRSEHFLTLKCLQLTWHCCH